MKRYFQTTFSNVIEVHPRYSLSPGEILRPMARRAPPSCALFGLRNSPSLRE